MSREFFSDPQAPTHVRTYVGLLGPNGEDVLDAPKNSVAQLVHFEGIKHRVVLGKRGPESWQEQQAVRQRALPRPLPRLEGHDFAILPLRFTQTTR